MAEAHDPYAALRVKDYRFLLAGSVLATLGSEILSTAVGWDLYKRTGSKLYLGLAGLLQFLPVLICALPAGHIADLFSRKRLYQLAQCVMTMVALGLAALSYYRGPVDAILLCLVCVGIARAFTMPSRGALVAQVVPLELLGNAVTWNSTGFHIANITGPAIAGAVLAVLIEPMWAYLLSACFILGCMLMLTMVHPRATVKAAQAPTLKSLLAGVAFVWGTPLLLSAITLDLFAVLLGGATALLPVYATDILDVGEVGYGWLRAAPAIGAVSTAFVLAHRPPLRNAGVVLLWSVTGFGAATIVFGLSDNFALSFAMLLVTGALDNVSVVVRGTLMQMLTPDEMRGRVAAVNSVFISSSNELGAYESGQTADWWGPVASVVVGGIGTILVVVAVAIASPQLRRLREIPRPAEEKPA
jgi:MFS family permease